jgi:hypothetical protein
MIFHFRICRVVALHAQLIALATPTWLWFWIDDQRDGEDGINVSASGNRSQRSTVLDLDGNFFDRTGVGAAEFR